MHRPKKPPLLSRLALHPLLLAAFPVLFLFAQNPQEGIVLRDLWGPLGLALGGAALLLLAGWVLFRNARAAALVVSAWALLFFSYGRVAEGLKRTDVAGIDVGRDSFLLPAWGVLAIAAIAVAYLVRRHLAGVTTGLNIASAVLVGMNVFSIAVSAPPETRDEPASRERARPIPEAVKGRELPDIYYIVPDRYGHPFVHREWFGVDTTWFQRYLKSRGFYVATRSMSNYPVTRQSLTSSLNLRYLNEETLRGIQFRMRNVQVARYLKSLGYRYVHIGSWYEPTAIDPLADVNINYRSFSEFSSALYQTTVLPPLARIFDVAEEKLDPRRAKWKRALAEFELVARARRIAGPKFVFAHIMFPHYQGPHPAEYTVDRNGNFVTREQELRRSYRRLYADQIVYATKRLKQLIDVLLADPNNRPIIVLQTDEGVYRSEELDEQPRDFSWDDVKGIDLRNKFLILNSYYLPGVRHNGLYPSITPVNSFRLIFNLYFRAGMRPLPDRHFVRESRESFRLVDITKRLRGLLRTVPLEPP
ncbi:MAG TPA: sulfatase-like hydrolase/transferase [Actinomycetota bacterium]|nr:sulfatase-like hydrolase/transferase [Actinomycetota bacterium]